MVNGDSTTTDWKEHGGATGVLPVGSFEQHGAHLPLSTDILCAEFFADQLARELDAALLPALPFGTCMEHAGFRGSISLRPETLMQVVRDVAAELETQSFQVVVLVNGHGGNFALGPVARDWNRRDRALKILLLNWWDFAPLGLADEYLSREEPSGLEFHAGEMETSVMLAIHPELVREDAARLEYSRPQPSLVQADLNVFGIGYFHPSGVVGFPKYATREKGVAVIEAVGKNMKAHARDRIERLRKNPCYTAAHTLENTLGIRALKETDLDAAMRLKKLASWNQTENDWRFLISQNPNDCWATTREGQIVGTTTVMNYGNICAWIGMVLVDPAQRRTGVATTLMQHAIDRAPLGTTLKLDATAAGEAVYIRLGFETEYSLDRWIRRAPQVVSQPENEESVSPLRESDWREIARFDEQVFGANRLELLQYLHSQSPAQAFVAHGENSLRGFCLVREGANFTHIGPVVAADSQTACALVRAAMKNLEGAIGLDAPSIQNEFKAWLQSAGFEIERSFVRMKRGAAIQEKTQMQFAIAGPEFG